MKKILLTISKAAVFFTGWALFCCLIIIPSDNPTVWRFWNELFPFAVVILFSLIFWLIEKRKISVMQWNCPLKNILTGTALGCIWIGIPVVILKAAGVILFDGRNDIPMLWLWAISCLLNVFMQEILIRGYIYQLIKSKYNTAAAITVTTLLFTVLHGGAFEEGPVPVFCVITMSLFMSFVMEYTKSLLAPVITHFIWNFFGAVIFNVVELADDYPHLFNTVMRGDKLLTGGSCLIEGSAVVLALNLVLCIIFIILFLKSKSNGKTDE